MIVRFLALLLLLTPAQQFAQTHAPKTARKAEVQKAAPAEWPIASLSVEGNQNYSKEQILGVAGLKVGQMAGKSQFDAARDRLVATGLFDTVSYRFARILDTAPSNTAPLGACTVRGVISCSAETRNTRLR